MLNQMEENKYLLDTLDWDGSIDNMTVPPSVDCVVFRKIDGEWVFESVWDKGKKLWDRQGRNMKPAITPLLPHQPMTMTEAVAQLTEKAYLSQQAIDQRQAFPAGYANYHDYMIDAMRNQHNAIGVRTDSAAKARAVRLEEMITEQVNERPPEQRESLLGKIRKALFDDGE